MDTAHLHLLLNHVPILGSFFGMIILGYGLLRKNQSLISAGLVTFVITGLVAIPAFFTGEAAEEVVENIAGISESAIELHEEVAEVALWLTIALAGVSLVVFGVQYFKNSLKGLGIIPLILSVVVFSTMAYVGYLGGQIRHTELGSLSSPSIIIMNSNQHEEDNDD